MAWTKEQINFLIENESTKTYHEIAKHLGKSVNAVQLKGLDLGIIKTRVQKPLKQKRCPLCLEYKKIESFYTYFASDRNAKRISNYCKPCSREHNRKRNKPKNEIPIKKQITASKTIKEQCADFLGLDESELSKLPGILESFQRNCVIRKKIQR